MAATRRRKAAPEPEPVETEDAFEELDDVDEDDDLEEIGDEDEVEEPAPTKAKRGAKKAAPAKKAPAAKAESSDANGEVYNTAWLAEHVTEVTGENHDSRSIRMLLRKMAANDELARVVGEDRTRYVFPKGPNDMIVRLVVKKVKAGELKAAKSEGLERVKKTAAAKKTTTRAAASESETAKRPGRKAAAKAAAPAKAAPTNRRRRAAAAE